MTALIPIKYVNRVSSRRLYLQAAVLLPLYMAESSFSFGCTGGPSNGNNFVPLPGKDFLSDLPSDWNKRLYEYQDVAIEQFLDNRYSKGKWSYSNSKVSFLAPHIAESPYSIPVEIGYINDNDNHPNHLIRSLDIYVQRPIYLRENVQGQLPVYNKLLTSVVANFEFGSGTLPEIKTRIQLLDSGIYKVIAVFSRQSGKVEVFKQTGSYNIVRCVPEVDGYLPDPKAGSS